MGFRFGPKTPKGLDLEFNYIHFGIKINKCLINQQTFKIFRPKNFFGLKNFKDLLISIPKCIELNSESKTQIDFFYSKIFLKLKLIFLMSDCVLTNDTPPSLTTRLSSVQGTVQI